MIEAPPTATDVNPSLTWMDYQPLEYETLLATTVDGGRRQFAAHLARDAAELAVYASQPQHFRNRARFALSELAHLRRLLDRAQQAGASGGRGFSAN